MGFVGMTKRGGRRVTWTCAWGDVDVCVESRKMHKPLAKGTFVARKPSALRCYIHANKKYQMADKPGSVILVAQERRSFI